MFALQEVNPNLRNIKPLDYAILAKRASQITEELKQVNQKMYSTYLQYGWKNLSSSLLISGTCALNSTCS